MRGKRRARMGPSGVGPESQKPDDGPSIARQEGSAGQGNWTCPFDVKTRLSKGAPVAGGRERKAQGALVAFMALSWLMEACASS